LLAAVSILGLVWATAAQAQFATYSLSGNSRAQIGDGLPLPITFQPPPNGKVVVTPDATVQQTGGADPKVMKLVNGTQPVFPINTATIGVHLLNKAVFQVRTSLLVNGIEGGSAVFSAGGRSGPQTFAWCPGSPGPATSANPNCLNASQGVLFQARLRYEGLRNQFGGVSRASLGGGTKGGASVVLKAGINGPCTHTKLVTKTTQVGTAKCLGAFSAVQVNSVAVGGGTLVKAVVSQLGNPPPIHPIKVTGGGLVLAAGPTVIGAFPANDVLSFGAPLTTGKVTVQAPSALGGAETFTLEGSDNRVDGIGSISFVSGGLSTRGLSGDNANRGWLNYQIAAFSVPSISNGGLILLSALLVAATAWMLRRAVVTSH
jgi:hypothetical protein